MTADILPVQPDALAAVDPAAAQGRGVHQEKLEFTVAFGRWLRPARRELLPPDLHPPPQPLNDQCILGELHVRSLRHKENRGYGEEGDTADYAQGIMS